MTLEEAFKLIRVFLNDGIKIFKENISKIEEIDSEAESYLNPELYSPKELILLFKDKSSILEYLQHRDKAHKVSLESKAKIEELRDFREIFGKSHLLKKVVDFATFLINLNFINYNLENSIDKKIIAQIIGMAIYNNNKIYEKKEALEEDLNSKNSRLRKECQAVTALKPYFAFDGTIIANTDVDLFVNRLTDLFSVNPTRNINTIVPKEKDFPVSMLIELLKENLLEVNRNKPKVVEPSNTTVKPIATKMERRQIMEQSRQNEQELATYCDGEQILRPCASIEEFEILVNGCNLSEENKTRIITKMNTFLNKNNSLEKISFLSMEEQEIYKLALEKQLGNIQVKKVIEEINMLLEMNDDSISKEAKEYIESEIKSLIERLSFILNSNSIALALQNNRKGNLYDN